MTFNYEGAKAEGYSDDEIAEHLAKRNKFNIQGARQEGYSSSDIIQHLLKKDSNEKSYLPEGADYLQMMGAIPETMVRGIGQLGGQIWGGLAGALEGAVKGGPEGRIKAMGERASQVAGETAEALTPDKTLFGPTTFLEKEVLHPAIDYVRSGTGHALEKATKQAQTPFPPANIIEQARRTFMTQEERMQQEQSRRTQGEVGFDVAMGAEMVRGPGRAFERRSETRKVAAEEQAQRIRDAAQQEESVRYIKNEFGKRDSGTAPESFEFTRGEEGLAPDSGRPTGKMKPLEYEQVEIPRPPTPEEIAIDAQTPRSPYAVGRTPPQLEKMNRASRVLPEDPTRPFYGDERVGLTRELPDTRYDLSRTQIGEQPYPRRIADRPQVEPTLEQGARALPGEQIPGVPFEPNRPFVGREEFAGTTGWQIADPRVAEAIAGDSYLKGMNTRLAKMEENLKGIGEMQGEIRQRYGDRRVRGGSGQQIGKELVAYQKSMNAVQRDITKLREAIDKRVKMHEERVRKQPKYEKTLDPFKKGPGGRQRGAINPAVFREGFEKVKELLGGRKMVAYATRDEYGPVFRISTRDSSGTELGSVDFIPTRGGLKRLRDRDLISALTEVDPQHQRQGIATEMYKFAHELGNDIIPSTAQTTEGKAMWQGFKSKGVPLSQRGGIHEDLLTLGLSKLIRKNSQKTDPKVEIPDPNKRQALLDTASSKPDSWDEFIRKNVENLKDLPDNLWSKSIEYFSNAQILYHDTKNPMVKWLADTIANEKAMADLKAEYGTQGVQFDSKGLLPKKNINPNSSFAHWSGLTGKERQLVTDIINKYSGDVEPSLDAMRAMGANQKVINALEVLQRPIKEALTDINAELVKNGRNPIKERPFYFMRNAGQGNWLVRVKDANGETIAFTRAQTKHHADGLAKSLSERLKTEHTDLGELKTEVTTANPNSLGNKYNISTTLLEDIYQALEKNDPRRAAIHSAVADIKSKGGFGAHRAFRKGVEGMENTPKEFWKTYEKYLGDAYNYEAGLRLSNLRKQIEVTEIPPGLKQWALGYIDRSRGGQPKEVLQALESGMDRVVSTITFGQSAPGAAKQAIRFANQVFTTQALFFWKLPFLAGQALQSTSFAPAVMALYKNHGQGSGVMKSMVYGAKEMFDKSPEFQGIVDYLSARGKVDPGLVHDFSVLDFAGAGKSTGKSAGKTTAEWVLGVKPAMKLEALNRVHAAAMGYHFLKDQLSGKELKAGVERFVDDVMGNYGFTDRPGIITRHGIAGEIVSPLSTFVNWYKGMSAVMLKEALQGVASGNMKKATPFLSMWLGTALMAGVMAAPLLKEIDWIWNHVKGLFGFNERTPSITEALLTSGMPDTAKFGALTGVSTFVDPRGVHLTSSMGAPEVMPGWVNQRGEINWKNIAPGVIWAGEGVISLTKMAADITGLKKMTVEERRQASKNILPSSIDSFLTNLDWTFEPQDVGDARLGFDGRPVPGKRGYGTVRRDGFETMASIVGSGTIPEVTEKMVNRDIKRETSDVGAKKSALVQRAVDALMYKTGSVSDFAKEAAELGFTDFDKAVLSAYKERFRTDTDRAVGTGTSVQQYENYKYIKRAVGQ